MPILNPKPIERPLLDLRGSDGNAFVIMAYAKRYAKQLDLDPERICAEMSRGDYEHLVWYFYQQFGDYVDVILPKGMDPKRIDNKPEQISF